MGSGRVFAPLIELAAETAAHRVRMDGEMPDMGEALDHNARARALQAPAAAGQKLARIVLDQAIAAGGEEDGIGLGDQRQGQLEEVGGIGVRHQDPVGLAQQVAHYRPVVGRGRP